MDRKHSALEYQKRLRKVLPEQFPELTFYFQPADMQTQILNQGLPTGYIMRAHLLPNSIGSVLVVATVSIAGAITLEATLSFLGVGVPPNQPSLGSLIRIGNEFLFSGDWWISMLPGAVLVQAGYRVLPVPNGREVVPAARRARPALVSLDLPVLEELHREQGEPCVSP